jgi:uncharacterized cupredoxin-like copper-binding protein
MSFRSRHPRLVLTAWAVTASLVTAACGGSGDTDTGSGATRTIDVKMVDIAFEPSEITVKKGEKVTLRFTNEGKIDHEAFIGDAEDQAEHEKDVAAGEAHHGDDGEGAVNVKPGKTATLTYIFDEAGSTQIGCHEPGHYAAGMKIDVSVE